MKNIFKADTWNGGGWLSFLCVFHGILVITYIWAHWGKTGYEDIQLDKQQSATVTNLLNMYPDNAEPTSVLRLDTSSDTVKKNFIKYQNIRQARTKVFEDFLQEEYDKQLDESQVKQLDTVLNELNTKDAITYLSNAKFKIKSYFWLSGGGAYFETLIWCLLGVLTSLIFYVGMKVMPKESEEDFDINEISNQVAKMFYAPITTLVLVIGYHFVLNNNSNMIDISVNKGLILFSFIAGFYSGRLMKLLDGLKEVLLPVSTKSAASTNTPEKKKSGISVSLKLSDSAAKNAEAPEIEKAGFKSATVKIISADSGAEILLENQNDVFTNKETIPPGKYSLKAGMEYKNGAATIELKGSLDEINIPTNGVAVPVALDIIPKTD